jgi:hypothetical protein
MKTSIVLDSDKIALARNLMPCDTLRELIDRSLDEYIATARRKRFVEYVTKTDFFKGDLSKMRKRKDTSSRGRSN